MLLPDDEKSRTPQTSEPSYGYDNNTRGQVKYTQHHSNTYVEGPPPYDGRPSAYDGCSNAYDGRSSTFDGRTNASVGRQSAYDGGPSAYDGRPNAYDGRPNSWPTPVAGPSIGSSSLLQRLRGSGGGASSAAGIMSDLPPAFSRPPPSNLPFTPFPPCALLSLSHELNLGFPGLPPPSMAQPHPFTLRDVHEDDWVRFLDDVKRAGALSPMNRVVAGVAPMAMGIGVLAGLLVSRGIEKRMKQNKVGPVTEAIDHWNIYFFHPRQMEVVLFQGNHPHSLSRAPSDSSSDSSDSDYSGDRRQRRDSRRMHKRERKLERCREKADRRGQGHGRKDARNERWQLVVSYMPPAFQPSIPQRY